MLRSLSERSETKGAEKRLVAILKDNPLGQGTESTPMGIIRPA
ncbi:hypothetical protein [Microbacterium azadirachtae]|uniref:Uncharacterized protein n=1 Tax=Microbacterium azadirachtae TaxID=582680 RepID=A0A0F0LG11_9MICO|nr:hypothetical protein [Microbacterium azadirachtae]KJL31624.1 hypothetical protein RS86_02899 [Microbacterium azadirachtae]